MQVAASLQRAAVAFSSDFGGRDTAVDDDAFRLRHCGESTRAVAPVDWISRCRVPRGPTRRHRHCHGAQVEIDLLLISPERLNNPDFGSMPRRHRIVTLRTMISPTDVDRVTEAARGVAPASESYLETDFVMNLLATVIDYQAHTTAVVRALDHYKTHRWDEIRTADELEAVFDRYPNTKDGNIALAQHLWGYNMWTRAEQLRSLTAHFRSVGVTDQTSLQRWAERSQFKLDFEGRVKGLGIAVYHWLVMRQGVDTVKPDVHVRRFAERAVRRPLSDTEVVDVVTAAAHKLAKKAYELDWAIWEASRVGGLD
jgi:hypothetical protein